MLAVRAYRLLLAIAVLAPAASGVFGCEASAPSLRRDGGLDPDAEPDDEFCLEPKQMCGTRCVNTDTDPRNCGDCGIECPGATLCLSGQCTASCGMLNACGSSCVDLATDIDHCGDCDQPCSGEEVCRGGACQCAAGRADCDGACVDRMNDPKHCGQCGRACDPNTETCSSGSCKSRRELDCEDQDDNDGDGDADCEDSDCAGTTRQCMGACGFGVETCNGDGTWADCQGGDGGEEICGDGIDQDCDGEDVRAKDAYEDNDDCFSCPPLSMEPDPRVSIQASIDSIEDGSDCFSVMVNDSAWDPTERIQITLSNIPSGHDYDLYLFRSSAQCELGNPIASSQNPGSTDEVIDWGEGFGGDDSGTYIVRVIALQGRSCDPDDRYVLEFNGLL